ncbi:thioredoxin domain-containing protein [Xanthomonas campestris pv. phormiicola]|nr:thioredoxin domain-containing protein [Xanthomonas campestris pv. phormiicola]UYC17417.1 thioredoxin domain-containing protein [Xanthomonas campestris pv. phormiicola]
MPAPFLLQRPIPRGLAVTLVLLLVALAISHLAGPGAPELAKKEDHADQRTHAGDHDVGRPWRYGPANANFTLVLYADFECPFCKSYYPIVKAWVDRHPDANLQWHHLPLSIHEPAASREALLAECVGQVKGNAAFWDAVTWIYQRTRSDGQGLPPDAQFPGLNPQIQLCIDGRRPAAHIQAHINEGARDGVTATPTLKVIADKSGKTLFLPGPADGDTLLSALDLLSGEDDPGAIENANMPADVVGDVPR